MEQHRLPPSSQQAPEQCLCPQCGVSGSGDTCAECFGSLLLHGRYRLIASVGRGATGTVFRAWDGERIVAIKELPLLRHEGAKARELLTREARVLESLDHPQVPRCHAHFTAGQGRSRAFYLVQDFIEGENLAAELVRGPLDEAAVLQVMAEVLAILIDLHGRSPPVLHRDIKPANLIRRAGDRRLVLLDFGAVRDVLRDSKLGGSTVAGTFGFMAPEQFQGDARPATDLYGLGALAVNLLTGRDPAKLHGWDGRFQWQSQAAMTAGLAALLRSLLHPDPARRLDSAATALGRVQAIQQGRVSRWAGLAGRQTTVLVLATALLLMFGVAAGGFLALSPSPPALAPPAMPAQPAFQISEPPPVPITPPAAGTITGASWSLEPRALVLLGPETVAVEFPLDLGGEMSRASYMTWSASVGGHRLSLRVSGTTRALPLEERVAQAAVRVSATSDSLSDWETREFEGAAQVIDDIVRLEVDSAELAGLIAASQDPKSMFMWSDAEGKRVTVRGTMALERPLAERPLPEGSLLPQRPLDAELLDPTADATCRSQLVVAPAGHVTEVRVTGCELPFAVETATALRTWYFGLTAATDSTVLTVPVTFRADSTLGELPSR